MADLERAALNLEACTEQLPRSQPSRVRVIKSSEPA